MIVEQDAEAGRFCWLDLAAGDAARAARFYARLLGWTAREQHANGGVFTRLQSAGRDVGSLYQIAHEAIRRGASSHWTPYVRVADVEATAKLAAESGGAIIVRPFVVSGVARIALIADSEGAQLGLWGALRDDPAPTRHG